MYPLESSSPITVDPDKYNVDRIQCKNFKVSIMNMFKDLKEDMYKSLNKLCESTINKM